MTDPRTALAERIADAWGGLSPQEQRVAEFLRAEPDESALYNSSELARRTGVSKATVSRLFRRLGFAGSQEAREVLRAQRAAGLPVLLDDPEDPLAAQVARDVEHLRRLAADLDRAALQEAAAALAAAPRVVVAGFRSGHPLAMLLRQALVQARPDVALLPEAGQTLGEELVGLGQHDAVVVIGLRRRPAGFDRVLDGVRAVTPNLLVLADPTLRRGPERWRFDVPVQSASPFDSYAAAACVLSVLAGEVLHRLGTAGAGRVAAIDRAYASLGELDPA
ncbi:MurR/RpiR family transcriptional regulator [Amnibacterium soli]|uniref:MurR/RpiR family transcriptional regulator n=1 Tax=Amnibacterium soli TaxID=1282736 RepID=A0ABP8ZGN1_9MICO